MPVIYRLRVYFVIVICHYIPWSQMFTVLLILEGKFKGVFLLMNDS